jgi:hypothetical protein
MNCPRMERSDLDSPEDLVEINRAASEIRTQGEHHPEELEARTEI